MSKDVFDKKFLLPLFPDHNNPWIYMAYFKKLFGFLPEERLHNYAEACLVSGENILYRWPDRNDQLSHDEAIGFHYVLRGTMFDRLFVNSLNRRFGYHNIYRIIPESVSDFFRWNIYRVPFVFFSLNEDCGIVPKILAAAHIFWKGFKIGSGWSGHLLIWICAEDFKKSFFTRMSLKFWAWRLGSKGITLEKMMSEYFNEYPMMGDAAKGLTLYGK